MKLVFMLGVSILLSLATKAADTNTFRVVARVNDHAITALDVEDRVKFLILSSNLQVAPEDLKKLRTQVIDALVEENLRLQEAKKKGVEAEASEIKDVMTNLEKQNNLEGVGLTAFLTQNGIRPITLENQIKSNIVWKKVVGKQCGPRLMVTPQEIDDELKKIKESLGHEQLYISEIKLVANTAKQKGELKEFANRLVKELRETPADESRNKAFDSLAHQFSHSSTALQGGDLGWITESALKPFMLTGLKSMKPGDISNPLSDREDEVVILFLKGKRSPQEAPQLIETIQLQQVFLTLDDNASFDDVTKCYGRLKTLKATLKSPDELKDLGTRLSGSTVRDLGQVSTDSLPPEVKTQLATLKENQFTDPTRIPGGMAIFLCGKKEKIDASLPTRELVEQQIRVRRLETFERRYVRDIHAAASIQLTP